jgi:hypothetical protein
LKKNIKIWSDAEIDFLKASYKIFTYKRLSEIMNINLCVLKNKIFELGLKKDNNAGKWEKGHESWNKGKKGTHFSPKTEFKKGHKPHNTKYDGCIRIHNDKRCNYSYYMIRIAEKNWQALHRVLWEKVNGLIPPNHVIRFKDNNPLNCILENLYMVPRSEHLQLNHKKHTSDGIIASYMSHKNPELKEILKECKEILELKRIQLLLKRELEK